jgi:hypothetical protein
MNPAVTLCVFKSESEISENNFKIFVVLATFASNMLVQARTPLVTALKIKMTVYCTDSINAVLLANNTLRILSDSHRYYRSAAPSLCSVTSVI